MEGTSSRRCLHVHVRGRVQGVGFRATTRGEALALGVRGWVRNEPDGSVRLAAEGEAWAVEALLAFLRRGPRGARVTGVDVLVEERLEEPLLSFEIR